MYDQVWGWGWGANNESEERVYKRVKKRVYKRGFNLLPIVKPASVGWFVGRNNGENLAGG